VSRPLQRQWENQRTLSSLLLSLTVAEFENPLSFDELTNTYNGACFGHLGRCIDFLFHCLVKVSSTVSNLLRCRYDFELNTCHSFLTLALLWSFVYCPFWAESLSCSISFFLFLVFQSFLLCIYPSEGHHVFFRGTKWTWSSSSDGCDCVMYVCREWTWDCISMLWAVISTKLCIDEGWSARFVEYDTIAQEMLSRCVHAPKSWWKASLVYRTEPTNRKKLGRNYYYYTTSI